MMQDCYAIDSGEDLDGLFIVANNIVRVLQIIEIGLIITGCIIVFCYRKSEDRPRIVNILYVLIISCGLAILFEFLLYILANFEPKNLTV